MLLLLASPAYSITFLLFVYPFFLTTCLPVRARILTQSNLEQMKWQDKVAAYVQILIEA